MTDESENKGLISAATEIAKAVPVYQDLMQPAARELGKGLETVAKTVNIALAPLAAMVWGYERIQGWLESQLSHELREVNPNSIVTPNPHVVGPAVEALRYAAENENLREMFAKLIATSMTKELAERAHPTFVEILKQISSDEAKIIPGFLNNPYQPFISIEVVKEGHGRRSVLAHWTDLALKANCDYPSYCSVYMENLARLGLLEFYNDAEVEETAYKELESTESILRLIESTKKETDGGEIVIERGVITRTMLGHMFMQACVGETSGIQANLKV